MSLTVTTWNVQNFARSDSLFDDKLLFLRDMLRGLGSDVVALQEVLDEEALVALAGELGFHPVAGKPDGRGNRVAFLTRGPIAGNAVAAVEDWRLPAGETVRRFNAQAAITIAEAMPRPALRLTIEHEGRQVELINVHLKSKLLTFPGGRFSTSDESLRAATAYFALARRAAEAKTLREVATELLLDGRDVILLGDFNDGPQAATTALMYGPPGSQPKGPEDAIRPSGAFQRSDAGDVQRLFNMTNLVPAGQRWSRRHDGQEELLDQILVSAGLMPRAEGLRQVPAVTILNDDVPNLFGTNPNQGGIVPDHAPVTAVFV
jgi:endonuclease/exonuclease/phosphatase family metal-dependent hydrolase